MAWLKNNYQFEFTDTLTTSWTSVRISNEKENGAVATFTNQYITVRSEDNSIVERMKGSAAGWVLTLSMRWLDQSDTDTEVVGLKKEWREWSKAFVTYVASQHVDPRDDNTFAGTQTFNNVVVSQDVTIWDDLTVAWDTTLNGKYKWPVVNDITARDALYPTPVDGNECLVASVGIQYYLASAWWRQTLWVSTPVPDATEIIKGKAQIATSVEALDWVNDGKIITPLKLKNVLDNISTSLYDTSTEILWESIVIWDSLFLDTSITFAWAWTTQRIWETISANARVSWAFIWSWIPWSTLKLSLSKTGTPTQNLNIRIETDNAGTPSWILADANAAWTVTQSSLTTLLADTTITLSWSVTLTKWTKYHIVLFQGTYWLETISASNYYNVWYSTNHTTVRGSKLYDWVPSVTDNNSIVYDAPFTTTFQSWLRVTANYNTNIISVTKATWTTATRCQIFTDWWSLLATATFSWNIATLWTPLAITSWTTYRILADNNGASYTWISKTVVSFPISWTGVTTIWWYYSWNTTSAYNIAWVSTAGNWYNTYNPSIQLYMSSTAIEDVLLMKTDADYTYKLPTNFPRIARQNKSMWETVIFDFWWVSKQCVWTNGNNAFISNTPWQLSTTAGTNSYKVWKFVKNNNLYINPVIL